MRTLNFTVRQPLFIQLSLAVAVTLFLFFIDEGYYNFKWMYKASNWLAFIIYVTLLFAGQILIFSFLFRKTNDPGVNALKYLVGIALGTGIAFLLLS